MKVVIIPEDFRKDQYILKPLVKRLFGELGRPSASVIVCNDPLLGGVREALKSERLQEVVERYPMADLFILCVDRDGVLTRRSRLDQVEQEFGATTSFIAENAWEELETWVLAGLDLPAGWSWSAIRSDISVKEHYFDELARREGVADGPGGGREALGEKAARRLQAIRVKCPEDFGRLAIRLQDWLNLA